MAQYSYKILYEFNLWYVKQDNMRKATSATPFLCFPFSDLSPHLFLKAMNISALLYDKADK